MFENAERINEICGNSSATFKEFHHKTIKICEPQLSVDAL
jgi:hypothetical protein